MENVFTSGNLLEFPTVPAKFFDGIEKSCVENYMENIKRGNVGNNGTIYLFEEKLFKYDKKESTTYE